MCYRFLCCKHRKLLTENPAAAEATWSKGINQGKEHYDAKEMDVAIACFGGAWEAAEILFYDENGRPADNFCKLTMATMFLARSLHQSGQPRFGRAILWRTSVLITPNADKLTDSGFSAIYAMDCIGQLENCHLDLYGRGLAGSNHGRAAQQSDRPAATTQSTLH